MLADFNVNLKKYARLIAETGVNVSKGHTVVLQINVEQAELARLITKEAYQLGADEVIVQWTDDVIQKEFLAHAADDRISTVPQYKIDQADDWIEKGASRISVVSSDPDAFAGVDNDRVATYQSAVGKALMNLRKATQSNKVSWTVVAAAGKQWAAKVFPDLPEEEQVDALWDEIFKTTRIYESDPVIAWKNHD
ncbi:aminopeptidase, partial [Enterococcus mundtii]|uniref:aminopeptidase n=2 Tax=Enterococcus TaxID=1350 RepID=UPI00036DB24F